MLFYSIHLSTLIISYSILSCSVPLSTNYLLHANILFLLFSFHPSPPFLPFPARPPSFSLSLSLCLPPILPPPFNYLSGHPIVGDVKYGAPQSFRLRDIALHSLSLTIPHPITKIEVQTTSINKTSSVCYSCHFPQYCLVTAPCAQA